MPAEGVGTVIIHAGTNNLCDPNQLPGSIAMQLEELALSIQERENNCAVIISSITVRNDNDYDAKSSLTNSEICKVCQTNKWLFVDNSNIDDTSLNRLGLHLNSKGDSLLASNIIRVLRGNSDRPTNPRHDRRNYRSTTKNRSGFRGSKMEAMWDFLKLLQSMR